MIKQFTTGTPGVIGLKLSSKLTTADYLKELGPILQTESEKGSLRIVLEIDKSFEGFTAGAMFEDLKLGVQFFKDFRAIAVVTDLPWIRTSLQILIPLIPGEIKLFQHDQKTAAIKWASGDKLGPIHSLNRSKSVLTIHPKGNLEKSDFDEMVQEVDPYIQKEGGLKGVLIKSRQTPGWQDMPAMLSHLDFIKTHYKNIGKVALVSDNKAMKMVPKLANLFSESDVKAFPYTRNKEARDWLER